MKCSDVTSERLLGEKNVIEDPSAYFIVLASSVKTLEVKAIEFHTIQQCMHVSQEGRPIGL